MDRGAWWATIHEAARVGHDLVTKPPNHTSIQFSSVQSLSHVPLLATPWTAARQAILSITNCRSLLKLMSIKSVIPSNHLILYRPLLLSPSIFPLNHIRWPKYWSFSFNISLSNEYSGLMVGSPCSPRDSQESSPTPQSKASILRCSAFFIVQLSQYDYYLSKTRFS